MCSSMENLNILIMAMKHNHRPYKQHSLGVMIPVGVYLRV